METVNITETYGQVYELGTLFNRWKISPAFNKEIPANLPCELVSIGTTEEEGLHHIMNCRPVFFPTQHAQAVFDSVGSDGLEFICDPKWNEFPRPKIAFVGGWGEPGKLSHPFFYSFLVCCWSIFYSM